MGGVMYGLSVVSVCLHCWVFNVVKTLLQVVKLVELLVVCIVSVITSVVNGIQMGFFLISESGAAIKCIVSCISCSLT